MLYLLDANVLIDASNKYYPISRVPEFWDWLVFHGVRGHVKVPIEIHEEVKVGDDDLADWAKRKEVKDAILLDEDANVELVSRVVDSGYAPDLTEDEIEKVGRDPFLIAYALLVPGERCIVTTENSTPKRKRANRHIPDVCHDLSIPCMDTFEFVRSLDFKTSWKKR